MKNRRFQKFIKYAACTAVMAALAILPAGCAAGGGAFTEPPPNDTEAGNTDAAPSAINIAKYPGVYDSEDVAVVVKKDTEAGTVQFQNISTSRRYTLDYDGITKLYDKNDEAISMEQLREGSIVTVRFYRPGRSLSYIKENPDCMSYLNVRNYAMDLKNGTISVGGTLYNISAHVVVVSDGRETDMMEVNRMDEISVWGYKNMIYGIHVEKGHGYLRLQNEDYFVGGWIDIGDKVVRKVAEDMLLVVPEGTYRATVSHRGSSATQEITFARNEEMSWDLGSVEITAVQKGNIIFTLTPVTAKVAVDGRQVNVSRPVELEYGIHQMRISADGYDTVTQYIKVAEPSANISVELEESVEAPQAEAGGAEENASSQEAVENEAGGDGTPNRKYPSGTPDDGEEEESSEEKSGADAPAVSPTGRHKVFIDAPGGVEAYLDGNYIGITPVSFNKTAGSYVITLRKSGYQTRSYTLQIDAEEKDVNYSFTELMKLQE